jgi:two-component system chemotaxis response regulator CheB
MSGPIRVLIVDDSAVVRQVSADVLNRAGGIQASAAADPLFALERMKGSWPDVIVLDVEMPRMDGITFLRKVMAERPTPVVMCSSLTEKGAQTTIQALEAGAVAIITKPKLGVKSFLQDSSDDLVRAVREAAQANVGRLKTVAAMARKVSPKLTADAMLSPAGSHAMAQTTETLVAIGTSTGGTQALEVVLRQMPAVAPGMVIVQHMPEKFTASFAERLNGLCDIEVREARTNDRVIPGRALIAPGGKHMLLKRSGAYYHVDVVDGPLVNRHRPSVDVLFRSVARFAGANAIGVIMTGMGDDGAAGMLEMKHAGAHTFAQDEATCVVFGMPKEAIARGAVDEVAPLDDLARRVLMRAARRG